MQVLRSPLFRLLPPYRPSLHIRRRLRARLELLLQYCKALLSALVLNLLPRRHQQVSPQLPVLLLRHVRRKILQLVVRLMVQHATIPVVMHTINNATLLLLAARSFSPTTTSRSVMICLMTFQWNCIWATSDVNFPSLPTQPVRLSAMRRQAVLPSLFRMQQILVPCTARFPEAMRRLRVLNSLWRNQLRMPLCLQAP